MDKRNINDNASGEAVQANAEESMIPKLFTVSSSPHVHHADNSRSIMLDVVLALIPALVWGVYIYGFRALTVTAVSIIFAVASEYIWEKLMKKPVTVLDFSAVVTGLLLALNLPVSVPLWMPAVGAVFAIIVVKQLFGGIGKNFVNPALAARVFLFAWPAHMGSFIKPATSLPALAISTDTADVVAGATPLVALKNGAAADVSIFDMLIGYESGCIGEVSALLLFAGFIYLLFRRVIDWRIPVTFIGTVFILTLIFPRISAPADAAAALSVGTGLLNSSVAPAEGLTAVEYALSQIFSGGLFIGAIFMATDYATSPVGRRGRIVYGIGCGLLTVFIRYFGGYAEGVSFAILIMNLLVWYLDRYLKPIRFGGKTVNEAK